MIDYGAVGIFATFLLSFIYFPARALVQNPLGPASGALVTMEQVCIFYTGLCGLKRVCGGI
jgi:hypothetical protein